MPLTKPRCATCDYNLRDIHHTLACPECGHPDRALLFDGRSRTLDLTILIIPAIMLVSFAIMVAPWLHTALVPQGKHQWALGLVAFLRSVLLGTNFIAGVAAQIAAYVVMIRAVTNHDLKPVKSVQIAITITLGAGAIILALLWA